MANQNRVPLNRTVKPSTVKLVKRLAENLELSEGRVLDRAVELLASGESFGLDSVRLRPNGQTMKVTMPAYAEGQCHWEVEGKIMDSLPSCTHRLSPEVVELAKPENSPARMATMRTMRGKGDTKR